MNNNLITQQIFPEAATINAPVSQTVPLPEKPAIMLKRIGSTTYQVSVHFSNTSKENIGDKITRLIQHEADSGKAVL